MVFKIGDLNVDTNCHKFKLLIFSIHSVLYVINFKSFLYLGKALIYATNL